MKKRDRKAVTYGAIVLLPALFWIWAVQPYRAALSDARDQLATERATLARELAAIETARLNPRLQHIADSAMRAMRPRLFEGRNNDMASAELVSYLADVALRTRVWLKDDGARPATQTPDGVRTLRAEIRGESDLLGTLMFLQALERGDKLVRVDRLDISRSPRADPKEGETLSIAATISGFSVGDTAAVSLRPPLASVPLNGGGR